MTISSSALTFSPTAVWSDRLSRAMQERIDRLQRERAAIEASLPAMVATVDDAERDLRRADERLRAARLELMATTNAVAGRLGGLAGLLNQIRLDAMVNGAQPS